MFNIDILIYIVLFIGYILLVLFFYIYLYFLKWNYYVCINILKVYVYILSEY